MARKLSVRRQPTPRYKIRRTVRRGLLARRTLVPSAADLNQCAYPGMGRQCGRWPEHRSPAVETVAEAAPSGRCGSRSGRLVGLNLTSGGGAAVISWSLATRPPLILFQFRPWRYWWMARRGSDQRWRSVRPVPTCSHGPVPSAGRQIPSAESAGWRVVVPARYTPMDLRPVYSHRPARRCRKRGRLDQTIFVEEAESVLNRCAPSAESRCVGAALKMVLLKIPF